MSWPRVEIGDIAPARTAQIDVVREEEIVWHLNLDQIEKNTGVVLEKELKSASEAGSSTYWFDDRNVLYSKLRPNLNKVVVPDERGLGTTELVPLCPDSNKLDRNYLAYYLRSPRFVTWITGKTSGAKMPRASMQEFWKHEMPLPALNEQKRIAAILDQADSIRRKRQKTTKLADQLLRSVFLDMFGDPVTNPKGWSTRKLAFFAKKITVGHVGSTSEHYLEDGIPFLRTGNVRPMYVNKIGLNRITVDFHKRLKKSTLKTNDVLVSRVGANRGMSCVVPPELDGANCANILIATLSDQYDPYFLAYLINSNYGQRTLLGNSVGSAQGVINTRKLQDWDVHDVPYEQQLKFRRIFDHISQQLKKYQSSLAITTQLLDSLSNNAFSGSLSSGATS